MSDELLFVDRYAVAIRYPGPDADDQEAVAASSAAPMIRDRCRRLLGLATSQDNEEDADELDETS